MSGSKRTNAGELAKEYLEIPRCAAGAFRLEIDSSGEAVLDGSCALKEYSENTVEVECAGSRISLIGDGLVISEFTCERFSVSGRITAVNIE